MAYMLPPSLLRHIREDVLGCNSLDVHWLNLTCNIRSLMFLKGFSFLMSGAADDPYEEVSRQEITFYDAHGHEIGFCLQESYFMSTWCCSANRAEGGETVQEALARLDKDAVSFVLVVFYTQGAVKNVRVYKVA